MTMLQLITPWESRRYLQKNNTDVLEQPSYSLVLTPCDFSFFPQQKKAIKVARFQESEAI